MAAACRSSGSTRNAGNPRCQERIPSGVGAVSCYMHCPPAHVSTGDPGLFAAVPIRATPSCLRRRLPPPMAPSVCIWETSALSIRRSTIATTSRQRALIKGCPSNKSHTPLIIPPPRVPCLTYMAHLSFCCYQSLPALREQGERTCHGTLPRALANRRSSSR